MFGMHKHTHFISHYGALQGVTVMHRMRTWYNQQARLAGRENRMADAQRFQGMADRMTANIKAAR